MYLKEKSAQSTDPMTIARAARTAFQVLAVAPTENKNAALLAMADRLEACRDAVIAANETDLAAARDEGVAENLVKRLQFGEQKIAGRIRSLRKIAPLPDPVGQIIRAERRPNGLEVSRVRVPLGVVLNIFEARPHVTVNAGAFCLKAGNAAIDTAGMKVENLKAAVKLFKKARAIDPSHPDIAKGVEAAKSAYADIQARIAEQKAKEAAAAKSKDDEEEEDNEHQYGREDKNKYR